MISQRKNRFYAYKGTPKRYLGAFSTREEAEKAIQKAPRKKGSGGKREGAGRTPAGKKGKEEKKPGFFLDDETKGLGSLRK